MFRTLPILVPNSFFTKIQALVNTFLWKGKKARWAFRKSIASRGAGEVGNVVIKDYHVAAVLEQLRTWFPKSPTMRWQELEEAQVPHEDLYDLLMLGILHSRPLDRASPTMVASLKAWDILLNLSQIHPPTSSFPISITSLAGIIPDLNIISGKKRVLLISRI